MRRRAPPEAPYGRSNERQSETGGISVIGYLRSAEGLRTRLWVIGAIAIGSTFGLEHHDHAGPRWSAPITVSATCYSQGTITASGEHVYVGEVANNQYPFGTVLRFSRPVFGTRDFRVEDRIGWGSVLDIYYPSTQICLAFGREIVTYRVKLP